MNCDQQKDYEAEGQRALPRALDPDIPVTDEEIDAFMKENACQQCGSHRGKSRPSAKVCTVCGIRNLAAFIRDRDAESLTPEEVEGNEQTALFLDGKAQEILDAEAARFQRFKDRITAKLNKNLDPGGGM